MDDSRREDFLAPDLAKDTTKRYEARGEDRPWTDMETRFMFHVLLACESGNAFNMAMQTVSRVIGRKKAFAPDCHPTPTMEVQGLFNLFEARRFKLLAGHKGAVIPDDLGDRNLRASLPLTYSEKEYFLKTYYQSRLKEMKNANEYVTPSLSSVCVALARSGSARLIRDYLAYLDRFGLNMKEEEDYTALQPHLKEKALADWWDDYGDASPKTKKPFYDLLKILEVL